MNETMTLCLEIIFWLALFVVFYTYLGYGIVLYILVKLKELFVKPVKRSLPASDADLPEVTLFITAFNEEDVVDEKMENSLELDYPADKLHIVWVTDGSDDGTNERLQTRWQGKATVHFQPLRQGKTAAMTRGMTLVDTPLVVFTDANTMVPLPDDFLRWKRAQPQTYPKKQKGTERRSGPEANGQPADLGCIAPPANRKQ